MALSFSQLLLLLLLFLARLFVSQGLFFASELREFSTVGRLGLLGDKRPPAGGPALRKCPGWSRLSKLSVFGEKLPQSRFQGFEEVQSLLSFILQQLVFGVLSL